MALVVKMLKSGNVNAGGYTDLYAVPASKSAMVTSVRLMNAGTLSGSVSLFVQPSSGAERRINKLLEGIAPGTMLLMQDPITLGQGDGIRVQASGTSLNIDWVVSGVERDI